MSDSIERVGIVGFGPMGQLVAEKMLPGFEVVACDPRITEKRIGNVAISNVDDVAQSDAVIMAVPARHLESALSAVTKEMPWESLLVDVSSVKLFPGEMFERFWPNPPEALLCHPLFGPQSAADSLEGHSLIVTERTGDKAKELVRLWGRLGLNIVEMTAEEHDRQMAEVHVKTMLLGRLASSAGDQPTNFNPPSHEIVKQLEALDAAQSEALFETIMYFNPYAAEKIDRMQAKLAQLRNPDPAIVDSLERHQRIMAEVEAHNIQIGA